MNQCILISRKEFFYQEHPLLSTNQAGIMAIVYIPQQWLREEKLSHEEKNQLLDKKWQQFMQRFTMPCICTRSGWSLYFVFVPTNREEVIIAFKHVVSEGETSTSGRLFWRIVLTELANTQLDWQSIIAELETRGRETVEQAKSQNLFLLHLDSQDVEVIL